jgi:hypothetical protein
MLTAAQLPPPPPLHLLIPKGFSDMILWRAIRVQSLRRIRCSNSGRDIQRNVSSKRLAKDPQANEYDNYARCRCSYHVTGTVGGQFIRRSLKTSDGERAARMVREMEEAGQPTATSLEAPITIAYAVEGFLADCRALGRSAATLGKYTHDVTALRGWCEGKGYTKLAQVAKAEVVREFRTMSGQNASEAGCGPAGRGGWVRVSASGKIWEKN